MYIYLHILRFEESFRTAIANITSATPSKLVLKSKSDEHAPNNVHPSPEKQVNRVREETRETIEDLANDFDFLFVQSGENQT